jgi:TIR domain
MSPLSAGSQARSANIFINYRREDSAGHAGRLFDGLSSHFPSRLFMDVDTIAPGIDFVDAIEQAVGACEVLIVVIGREWLTLKNAAGGRRIDEDGDFVRLELEHALARNIRVIPVLVQGAEPPRPEDLPPSLAKLARRNAIELSDARWGYDVDRLAQTIQGVLGEKTPAAPPTEAPGAPPPATAPKRRPAARAWVRAAVFLVAALLLAAAGWISKDRLQSPAVEAGVSPAQAPASSSPAAGPEPAPALSSPALASLPAGTTTAPGPAPTAPAALGPKPAPPRPVPAPVPSPAGTTPAPAQLNPAAVPSRPSLPEPDADIKPVEPAPALPQVETLQLPGVAITSPKNGEKVGGCVTVNGVISAIGSGQRAFLCFRTQGKAYSRGELFPGTDGRWSITTDSSHHDFDVLVVITTSPEAVAALNDPWTVPPKGAHIAPTTVSVRTQSKVMKFLKSKCGKNGP